MEQIDGMMCPHCRVNLVMSERQRVEIDYCPKCRGVWLDRGELDTIIERAMAEAKAALPSQAASFLPNSANGPVSPLYPGRQALPAPYAPRGDDDRHHDHDDRQGGRRREGFFERLFD